MQINPNWFQSYDCWMWSCIFSTIEVIWIWINRCKNCCISAILSWVYNRLSPKRQCHWLNFKIQKASQPISAGRGRPAVVEHRRWKLLPVWSSIILSVGCLSHWGRDKMDATSQTTCSSVFSWMKMFEFRLKFHWRLFLRVKLSIFQHCFR